MDDNKSKVIQVIMHQDIDFLHYYNNNSVLARCYILGIEIRIIDGLRDLRNEIKQEYLTYISYAINKIIKKVSNLPSVVKVINVYIEKIGRIEVRWPEIEDKETYNTLKNNNVWVNSPCLHINDNTIKQVSEIKFRPLSFGCFSFSSFRNENHMGKIGVDTSGVPDQLNHEVKVRSNLTRVVATIVHEIGHILHAQQKTSHNKFWEGRKMSEQGKYTIPARIAEEVSNYVIQKNNSNEFVAEVFTGLIYGKKYSKEVLEYYKYYSGPEFTDADLKRQFADIEIDPKKFTQ
ncbi:hypothetical protein ID853_10135 [Xenorhabdus sp. Vera]|uniref:hypothetical protein n=1 Tax=Xenorhabdus koppenhoeferi TaxID=351659 RepID=UPI0019B02DD8|nr:hypothetical protein [Xenorhabdus sp. Vera]MBD2811230.1 hypothetical protein [Xenorhabdus sp. Vera]